MTIEDVIIGRRYRFWLGQGFIRTGIVRRKNIQGNEVFVEWDYDIPSDWERADRIC